MRTLRAPSRQMFRRQMSHRQTSRRQMSHQMSRQSFWPHPRSAPETRPQEPRKVRRHGALKTLSHGCRDSHFGISANAAKRYTRNSSEFHGAGSPTLELDLSLEANQSALRSEGFTDVGNRWAVLSFKTAESYRLYGFERRYSSTAAAALRPSAIAHTTSDCPRRISPAAKTPDTELM